MAMLISDGELALALVPKATLCNLLYLQIPIPSIILMVKCIVMG